MNENSEFWNSGDTRIPLEKPERVAVLEFCGLDEAGQDAEVCGSGGRAGAKAGFAAKHHGPHGAFGEVVGGRESGMPQEREPFEFWGHHT